MADKDTEAERKKLKDLEESLARELDQQVNLSKPTDTRLSGGIELNPNLGATEKKITQETPNVVKMEPSSITYEPVQKKEKATPEVVAASAPAPAPEVGEVSLEDLDALLMQESPELKAELDKVREAGKDIDPSTVNITATEEGEAADLSDVGAELPQKIKLWKRIKLQLGDYFRRLGTNIAHFPKQFFKYLVAFLKNDLIKYIKKAISLVVSSISRVFWAFKGLSLKQKFLFFGLILLCGLVVGVVMSNFGHILMGRSLFFNGFADMHLHGEEYESNKLVPLSEAGVYPEHVVLIQKVTVNLKPSASSSANPMVAMRLYLEATTNEGAIEIKARENEIRDLIQRILETFTYDQIITARGKQDFKEALRKEISAALNTGLIKNIFLDDLLIKP